jgi:hypothetical protein
MKKLEMSTTCCQCKICGKAHSDQILLLLDYRREYDTGKATSTSNYTVGATSDALTNAWVADPGSPIIIRGGEIFSQPGTYKESN